MYQYGTYLGPTKVPISHAGVYVIPGPFGLYMLRCIKHTSLTSQNIHGHTYVHIHIHIQVITQIQLHMHVQMRLHVQIHLLLDLHIQVHILILCFAHTHTQTHTHAYTYTSAQQLSEPLHNHQGRTSSDICHTCQVLCKESKKVYSSPIGLDFLSRRTAQVLQLAQGNWSKCSQLL